MEHQNIILLVCKTQPKFLLLMLSLINLLSYELPQQPLRDLTPIESHSPLMHLDNLSYMVQNKHHETYDIKIGTSRIHIHE